MARYRSKTAPPNAKPSASEEKSKLTFVCLPTALLKKPPIRYCDENRKAGLSVFEFALAAACAALARAQLADVRHADLSRRGAIARVDFKWPTQGAVMVEVSTRELFRIADLSRKGSNLDRLPQAFRRLTEPLPKFAPALEKWRKLPGGRLELHVRAEWVPGSGFDRVPWPLPTSGPTVLNLFLFLFGADRRPDTDISMEIEKLYRRLGIPLQRHAQRSLDRALRCVNQHLTKLNRDGALDQAELPVEFHIAPILRGTRVQFRADEVDEYGRAPSRLRTYFRAADRIAGPLPYDLIEKATDNGAAEFHVDASGNPRIMKK